MRQFSSAITKAIRLLGVFAAFGIFGAQAETQNSITALNASSVGDGKLSSRSNWLSR